VRKPKHFYVYIMTNGPRSHVLYAGVTGNLQCRVFEHKSKLTTGFTSRYNLTRLVYYEMFVYPREAIAREKEMKGWRRSKKVALIEKMARLGCGMAGCVQAGKQGSCRPAPDPSRPEGRSG
jgi:putative endonuclease